MKSSEKLVTIPKEEYASLLETVEILSNPKLMKELKSTEKKLLNEKHFTLKDI